MAKKIKIVEKKSSIKILPSKSQKSNSEKHESLEETLQPETSATSFTSARSVTPTLRETQTIKEIPAQNISNQQTQTRENAPVGYEIQTDDAAREGYIFRPSERTFYENSRRQRTGEVSGQRANPTIQPTNAGQDLRLGANQTALQNNNVVNLGDNDRQYVQYEDRSELRTKKRADWRL